MRYGTWGIKRGDMGEGNRDGKEIVGRLDGRMCALFMVCGVVQRKYWIQQYSDFLLLRMIVIDSDQQYLHTSSGMFILCFLPHQSEKKLLL